MRPPERTVLPANYLDIATVAPARRIQLRRFVDQLDPTTQIADIQSAGLKPGRVLLITTSHVSICTFSGEVGWSNPLQDVRAEVGGNFVTPSLVLHVGSETKKITCGKPKVAAAAIRYWGSRPANALVPDAVMTVVFVRGCDLSTGQHVGVRLSQHDVEIADLAGHGGSLKAAAEELRAFDVGGPGAVTENAGFVGLGVQGWAKAGLLNELTKKTSIETYLKVATADWTIVLFSDQTPPETLQAMAPVRSTREVSSNGLVASELAQLAELHRTGALTDEEFSAAKSQLLGS